MGCMDQGRLKETQVLNPSAWNAHLYIYIYIWADCFSWCTTPWTLVFGILVSKCLHADPTLLKVFTLHLFFPTFLFIILALFLM